jgi:hypothetical protein
VGLSRIKEEKSTPEKYKKKEKKSENIYTGGPDNVLEN